MRLSEYIDQIRQAGKMSFSSNEATNELQISAEALAMSLIRLRKKGAVVTPYKNFHLIVPPEYRSYGCLPANLLIPLLMDYLKIPYYICLLSAAEMYGASHQRPQVFQVMISKRMRPIRCGMIAIDFTYKKEISDTPLQQFNVQTGYLLVSTPEATAKDLLQYPERSGGINHIATVLTELLEVIEPEKLLKLAKATYENAWVQRLGYLLEKINPDETAKKAVCIKLLKKYIDDTDPSYIPLIGRNVKGIERNKIWRVIVNTKIESDI